MKNTKKINQEFEKHIQTLTNEEKEELLNEYIPTITKQYILTNISSTTPKSI